ncbi:TetR family transcriptional regulator [Tomitella fengzijianii]|uniref:TetR/AcrR family transcriptional regulator n=1 Tax=Tomitella fengzijianii TaxID=2597660 RepID=A0A516X6Q2_9ACTN|nr:TetR family transcriptional regulator [Tomitella fengzijianii]QDQ98693.1 TetR/AcrR family transcriptional regulator [Tomitella fengzijianii]
MSPAGSGDAGAAAKGDGSPTVGPERHRNAVQQAAARLFSEKGFTATGVREIAGEAGVDPALVIRYFGSKEKLFLRTMTMSVDFADLMGGPLDGLGERAVAFVLDRTRGLVVNGPDATRSYSAGVFAALLRASDRPTVRAHLAESVEEMFVGLVAGRLSGADADLRARLMAAQLTGLMTAMHVVEDPGLTDASDADIVRYYGRSIQQLIEG